MPILNIIAAANFIVFYFVDKKLFISLYRSPHRFTTKIGRTATSLIPIAVGLHLAMAIWALSNTRIFSDNLYDLQGSNGGRSFFGNSIYDRVTRKQTLPLFLMLIVIIAVIILYKILKHVVRTIRQIKIFLAGDAESRSLIQEKLRQQMKYGAQVLFDRAVQRNIIKGTILSA
jgi:hypothetical protein